MATDSSDRNNEIADAIQALFGPQDEAVLVVGGDSVYGHDDITALRLLVSHMYDEIHSTSRSVERNLIGAGVTPTKEADARRAKVQEGLQELAQASDVDFIVCYHVRGTPRWDMAWSQGLTRDHAIQWMSWLLKGHLENPLELFVV
jgi:hypothetical protein